MPIYEYLCKKCGGRFEFLQRIHEPPIDSCSKCGGRMQKLISNTSFVLKGSGWYVTDYGSKKGKDRKERKEDKGTESTTAEKKEDSSTKENL